MKLQKKALSLMHKSFNSSYRIHNKICRNTIGKDQSLEDYLEEHKEELEEREYQLHYCFANYLNNSTGDKRINNSSSHFYTPMIIDLKRSVAGSAGVEAPRKGRKFNGLPVWDDWLEYVDTLLLELNKYIEVHLDKETLILYIVPRKKTRRLYMLLFLTKLRTIFESPYIWTGVLAKYFKEDFDELDLEEINYLLGTFVSLGSNGHGIYKPLCHYGHYISKYTSFATLMEKASKKAGTINGDGGLLTNVENKTLPFQSLKYPAEFDQRYKQILDNKIDIINKFIKV